MDVIKIYADGACRGNQNTTNIGGKGRVYKDVKLDDHLFEVAALKIDSKIDIIKALYYILTSKINK